MRPELKLELFTAVFTCKLQSLQLSPENAGDLPDELLVDFAFIFLSSCSLAPYLRSIDVRNTAAMSSMDRTHRVNRLGNHALGYHEGLRIPNHRDAACMGCAQELRHKLGSKTQNKHAKHPLRVSAVTSLCQRSKHPAISNAVARLVQVRPSENLQTSPLEPLGSGSHPTFPVLGGCCSVKSFVLGECVSLLTLCEYRVHVGKLHLLSTMSPSCHQSLPCGAYSHLLFSSVSEHN